MSMEMLALRVLTIIQYREDWLKLHGLHSSILLSEYWKTKFLKDAKDEYHDKPEQKEKQEADARTGKGKPYVRRKKCTSKRNTIRVLLIIGPLLIAMACLLARRSSTWSEAMLQCLQFWMVRWNGRSSSGM